MSDIGYIFGLSEMIESQKQEIAQLKAQLAQSIRVHPMSELPEENKSVFAITTKGDLVSLCITKQGAWEYFMYTSSDFIGWIDPKEIGTKQTIDQQRQRVRDAGGDGWDGCDPKKELEDMR
jgi:hypothetical protein